LLEHGLFLIATLLIGSAAILCTRSGAFIAPAGPGDVLSVSYGRLRRAQLFGEWCYAIGLASLAPLWGSVLLITAESIRILRLVRYERALSKDRESLNDQSARALKAKPDEPALDWGSAFRLQVTKWGVFLTMIVFTTTLIDRVADYGIVASVLAWLPMNLPFRRGEAAGS
jgi:hypothetical protein